MLVTDLVPLCSALKSSFPWAASPANDEEALSRMLSRVLAPLPPDHLPPLVGKGLPALIPGPMPLGAKLRVSLDGVLGAASLGGAGVTAPWPGGSGAEGSASLPRKVPGTFPTWPWAEAVPCNLQLPPLFVKHFSSLKDPRVTKALMHRIAHHLKHFPGYAQVRRLHPELTPWTVDDGLLTPTLKVRRNQVQDRYRGAIEAMYADFARS